MQYSNKTRELKSLVKRLHNLIDNYKKKYEVNIKKLIRRINSLLDQLQQYIPKHQLKGIIAPIAVLVGMTFSNEVIAQEKGFSYQAVIMKNETQFLPGNNLEEGLLSQSDIAIRFTIENNSGALYQEIHTTKTDAYGMLNLFVGKGLATIGDFTDIVWNGTEKYLRVEIDFTASGTSYESLDRQLMSYLPQPLSNESVAIIEEMNANLFNNATAIADETTRATIAEQANANAITAEEARATGAEVVNATAITAEEARAAGAEAALLDSINMKNFNLGTVSSPSITFKGDTNTGIYSIGEDKIAMTTGGVKRLEVDSSGLTVLQAIKRGAWEDGHMGNSTALVFTPTDFVSSVDGIDMIVQSSNPNPVRGSMYGGTTSTNTVLVAQKLIPKGFKIEQGINDIIVLTPAGVITNVLCYVSAQSLFIGPNDDIQCLLSSTIMSTNIPSPLNCGVSVVGDGYTMVTISLEFPPGMILTTSNSLAGASITMTRE